MKTPSPRQQAILDFVRQQLDEGQPVPTLREIATHVGLRSFSTVKAHFDKLQQMGLLKKKERAARVVRLTGDTGKRLQAIPLLGAIPAGHADYRSQDPEGMIHIDLDSLKIPRSNRTFALKVTGDSMIGKHIMDGDIVVLEQNADPRPGDVVAALIDGQSTLKTFVLDRGRPYLRAENPRYPNLIPMGELMIQGVLRMLVRTPHKKTNLTPPPVRRGWQDQHYED